MEVRTMPSSTLTSKGQTTIPKEIREYLNLRSGQRIDFVVDEDGRVILRPATFDIRDLAGILRREHQEPISVEEMNRVIRSRHGPG
jgi:antitoxin PrlF